MAKQINSKNFESDVLNSEKPVVIDFWAPWCGPCMAIGSIIDELSTEMKSTVTIGKVNIDECPDIAGRYGVMSIPTILIIKNGSVIGQIVGAQSKEDFKNRINNAIEA